MAVTRAGGRIAIAGALALAAFYLWSYIGHPAAPNANPLHPEGWWGWFDQGKTLRSAQAFAHADLRATEHWYPLGYSLLGAPFIYLLPQHPFAVVDLAFLLAAYAGFVSVARRMGVLPVWSAPLFLLATCLDPLLFQQWVIPWNTTPAAGLIWLLLAATAAELDGEGRPFRIGLLAGLVPVFRPTEMLVIAPCVLAASASILLDPERRRPRAVGRLILGAAVPVVLYLLLHLVVYGPHPSQYMADSRRIGFSPHALAWKAYVLLVEPRVWFGAGQGLIARAPWLAVGAAGLLAALLAGRIRAVLAVVLLLHAVLYISYVDLLPSGLWRYNLTHYWVWTFPGYALLAFLLLRDLVAPPDPRVRQIAGGALVVTLVLLCLRLDPAPADGREAFAVDFAGPEPRFEDAYFGHWRLVDAAGAMANIASVRGTPMPDGMRIFALRRRLVGDERLTPFEGFPAGSLLDPPIRRWGIGLRFGNPCWLTRCQIPGRDRMFIGP